MKMDSLTTRVGLDIEPILNDIVRIVNDLKEIHNILKDFKPQLKLKEKD